MKADVLHLIDNFEQGGTERQALQLVRLLAESGRFGVRLACFERRGSLLEEALRLGLGEIEEYPLRSFYDANAARQFRRFARRLRREGVRIVHAHGFYTNVFGVIGASLAGTPAPEPVAV